MKEVTIILAAYHEYANWARHYDTVHLGVTSLLLTLAGGAGPAVLALSRNRKGQLGICSALVCVGAVLTVLSSVYLVKFHQVSGGSGKLLKLAVEYSQGERPDFCYFKIQKKLIQGSFERFDREIPPSVAGLGCKKDDSDTVVDDITGESLKALNETPGWKAYIVRTLTTGWFWLNLSVGIVFPAVLLRLVLRGVFDP